MTFTKWSRPMDIHRFFAAAAIGLLSFSLLFGQDKSGKPAELAKAAEKFVDLLDKGEFGKAAKQFDAAMLKALPPDELKKTWEKVIGQAGAYKKRLASRHETTDKHKIVFVTCE